MDITAGETIQVEGGTAMIQSIEDGMITMRVTGDPDTIPGIDPALSPGNAGETDRFYYEIVRKSEAEIEVDMEMTRNELESITKNHN